MKRQNKNERAPYSFNTVREEEQIDDFYAWMEKMRQRHGHKYTLREWDEIFDHIYDGSCGGVDLKGAKARAKKLGLSYYGLK